MRPLRHVLAAIALLSAASAAVASGAAPAGGLPSRAAPPAHEHADEHAHGHGPDSLDLDPRGKRVAGWCDQASGPCSVDAHAPWHASEHDGLAFAADQPDVHDGLPQIHAIYLYPSNAASRFSQYAAMFQADARDASRLIEEQYGRGLRFDERVAGDRRVLDISVVRSKYNAKQLAGGRQWSLVRGEIFANPEFTKAHKKYVVWLDAGSNYCGQAELYQDTRRSAANSNEQRTLGIVYRPYSQYLNDGVTGGFCRGRTLRHEIGHNLGALQKAAPNDFDGAHCSDDANDTMCYPGNSTWQGPIATFDTGQNDYWDPAAWKPGTGATATAKLGWWTANLSRFVCPATASGAADCAVPNSPDW